MDGVLYGVLPCRCGELDAKVGGRGCLGISRIVHWATRSLGASR